MLAPIFPILHILRYVGICRYMEVYECIWRYMTVYEGIWGYMMVYQRIWRYMKVYEVIWSIWRYIGYMKIYGRWGFLTFFDLLLFFIFETSIWLLAVSTRFMSHHREASTRTKIRAKLLGGNAAWFYARDQWCSRANNTKGEPNLRDDAGQRDTTLRKGSQRGIKAASSRTQCVLEHWVSLPIEIQYPQQPLRLCLKEDMPY